MFTDTSCATFWPNRVRVCHCWLVQRVWHCWLVQQCGCRTNLEIRPAIALLDKPAVAHAYSLFPGLLIDPLLKFLFILPHNDAGKMICAYYFNDRPILPPFMGYALRQRPAD